MSSPIEDEFACLPDVNRCPSGWEEHGNLCVATSTYTGLCNPSAALSDMTVEEKLAFARYCQVEFPCQENCPPSLEAVCPSLWSQISPGVCEAPSNYIGHCAHRVRTDAMTKQDKINFGLQCGARWPCAASPGRIYEHVCPQGWTLHFGQTCTAPSSYQGPCGSFARMSELTKSDKQVFEATCNVSWPLRATRCEPDYSAACPYGWQERKVRGHIDCVSPPMYEGCSGVQIFTDKTFIEKQHWERNCGQRFPCRGESQPLLDQAVKLESGPVDSNGNIASVS